ncbi:MAG: pitrilysin family protein [Clostridiales bacterium]
MGLEYKKYNKFEEIVYTYKHKSGFIVDYIPRKGYEQKSASLDVYFGAIDEKFKIIENIKTNNKIYSLPLGAAHFLEHKIFEQRNKNVTELFSLNGSEINAFTSHEKTGYYFYCINKFYENLRELLKFIFNPYFTNKAIQNEKLIIEQEMKMNYNDPHWIVDHNMYNALYHTNSVKYDIAGTVDSIKSIDKELLYFIHKIFYNPQNLRLLVIGDLEIDKIIDIIECNVPTNETKDIERIFLEEPKNIRKSFVIEKSDILKPIFSMSIKENNLQTQGVEGALNEIAINLILEIAFGESSNFYQELYNDNIINDSFDFGYEYGINYAFSNFCGESENPKLLRELYINEIIKINKNGLNYNDFKRISNAKHGRNLQSFDSIGLLTESFLPENHNNLSLFDYCDLNDKITFEYVNSAFKKHFKINNLVLSILES